MEPAVAAASAATDLTIGVYANAFLHAAGEEDDGTDDGANQSLHDIRSDVTPDVYLAWARTSDRCRRRRRRRLLRHRPRARLGVVGISLPQLAC